MLCGVCANSYTSKAFPAILLGNFKPVRPVFTVIHDRTRVAFDAAAVRFVFASKAITVVHDAEIRTASSLVCLALDRTLRFFILLNAQPVLTGTCHLCTQ